MSGPSEPASPPPPPDAVLAVDPEALAGRLLSIPDGDNAVLRLADGRRTLRALVEEAGGDAGGVAAAVARLLEAGVLRVVPPGEPAAAPHGPDGADWFASPATQPRMEAPVANPEAAPAAVAPEAPPVVVIAPPVESGRSRVGVALAAALLGAVILAGALWARGPGSDAPVVPAPPAATSSPPRAAQAPPALAVTEPALPPAYRDALVEVGTRAQAGDLAGAYEAARRAVLLDPQVGAGWLALGEVLLASGEDARARDALQRYLELEPEGRHAARVRALLARLRP